MDSRSRHPLDLERMVRQADPNDPLLAEALVHAFFEDLVHLSHSILDDPDEAKDAAQETLIAAIKNLHRFRGDAALKTWLFSIGINTCRGRLRKRKSRQRMRDLLEQAHILSPRTTRSPESRTLQKQQDTVLWNAVDALDEKHRLPIVLRYAHDLSASEIAETLGINEGTVHSRLHYARKKLRAALESDLPDAVISEDARNG